MRFPIPKLPSFLKGKKKEETKQVKEIKADHHKLTLSQLTEKFNTSLQNGLTSENAAALLIKNGPNAIKQVEKSVILKIINYLLTGFCGILWIGALICILAWKPIGDPPDPTNLGLAILLVIVIFLQAGFSAFQDWSSNKVMSSIKNMMPSSASVIRNGTEQKVSVESLVVGDLIVLSYGSKVPADVRLTESHDLKFDKSMLTGESEAIEGTVECTDDRYVESKNIAYMTTLITQGQGKGVVVEVGENTMMGSISKLTSETEQRQTSLQKEINRFVIFVVVLAVSTVAVLLIVWGTWLRNQYPNYISVAAMMVNVIGVLVAFIPTGLPVAVTLSLLLMARKMAKHKVLVKNLTTIETLSSVNVIASDKTGTLTQNKMFVSSALAGLDVFDMRNIDKVEKTNSFKNLVSTAFLCNNASFVDDKENESLQISMKKAKGDATDIALLRFSTENIDPYHNAAENYTSLTEIPFNSKNKWMMKFIVSNDYELHNNIFGQDATENVNIMLLKGAPDILLKKCNSILQSDGSSQPMDDNIKLGLIKQQNDWCILGQRVLLLCKKEFSSEQANELCTKNASGMEKYVNELKDCCLIGMLGIIDPPRENMSDVISKCRGAGIRVFMVTGDYALTAALATQSVAEAETLFSSINETRSTAIAAEIGIFTNGEYDNVETMKEKKRNYKKLESDDTKKNTKKIYIKNNDKVTSLLMTGSEIETLEEDDWRYITTYDEIVLARTTPEQKLITVKEFRKDGFIVAVTGDGVNDAPALKNADIGIAMGSGSEVAMEAAQMVLLDSSFTSILIAIENGRLVFFNLRKVILYLLPAGSFAEVVPILVTIFLGVPLPLSAFLMICICILTDMAPALALMLEKPESDLLKKPPRSQKDHLVDSTLILQAYLFIGMLEAILSHCLFFWYYQWYAGLGPSDILFCFDKCNPSGNNTYKTYTGDQMNAFTNTGQTIVFIGLVFMQIFGNVFATRTAFKSIFQKPPWGKKSKNLWIFGAQLISFCLMILVVFVPPINTIFKTSPPPVQFFFIPIGFALLLLTADELRKLCVRKKILFFHKIAW